MLLAELIKQQIKSHGPMTFEQFMTLALYHPRYGYYTSTPNPMGRAGDFYTAPTVSPLFGAMLARQFDQMWRLAGCPAPWVLVEYGPGTGQLARDVVTALAQDYPHLYEVLEYYLVEISDLLRQKQKKLLTSSGVTGNKCRWAADLAEIRNLGRDIHCVYANELVDAFPVHVVVQGSDGLQELYVDHHNESFHWREGPLSHPDLATYFEMQQVVLAPGQRAEVNLQAGAWLAHVALHMESGFVLIIDYGLEAQEMYLPQRHQGTLRCFYKHRLVDNPLINIGAQDITANVNFTALGIGGQKVGLSKLGLISQPKFLINLGILETLHGQKDYDISRETLQKANAIKRLVLPGGMGNLFKVLVLAKGLNNKPVLTCFK